MSIPNFPEWAPISLAMRDELMPRFKALTSGISEFTFSNIFLFRHTYGYELTHFGNGIYGIRGAKLGKTFLSLPWGLPEDRILQQLFQERDFLKNLSREQVDQEGARLRGLGLEIREDRDNWDYLYDSQEMAHLEGKKFHKKRNLIHGFFQNHTYEAEPLGPGNRSEALKILEIWSKQKQEQADYLPCVESLEYQKELELVGKIYRIQGQYAAYSLGESVQNGKSFVIHFEKADQTFKGIYQVIFQDWARDLAPLHPLINREQDLGDPGLRQAKETYRPVGFVEKFQVWPQGKG